MMQTRAIVVLVYGILLLIGGIIGHLKAGSNASLIMGGISAIVMIACSVGMYKKSALASTCALIFAILLTLFFGYRFFLSYKFMPAGLMAIISLVVAGVLVVGSARRKD